MFIEYCSSDQKFVEPELGPSCWLNATGGAYRPTWLVRTSDWKLVRGTEAIDGYCALSYCWEQSGEIIKKAEDTGEYDCCNNPGHRLVVKTLSPIPTPTTSSSSPSLPLLHNNNTDTTTADISNIHEQQDRPATTARPKKPKEKNTKNKSNNNGNDNRVVHFVTYDVLLQRICHDFHIDYLWYDKLCINQFNKAEKLQEIKQMHMIYSNARYTVALIPEIDIWNNADFERPDRFAKTKSRKKVHDTMWKSLWSQRSWTFEELMMSKKILVVGKNAHAWHQADTDDNDDDGNEHGDSNNNEKKTGLAFGDPLVQILDFKNRKFKSANQVLKFAQFRTSTKEHDKIFALANIFHGVIPIDIDYDSNIQDVIHDFYRHVAEHDLSILCFGSVRTKSGGIRLKSTMASYNLPTWTGVRGLHTHGAIHVTQLLPTTATIQEKKMHYVDDTMRLHIKCKYLSINPTKHTDHPNACILKSSPLFMTTEEDEEDETSDSNGIKLQGMPACMPKITVDPTSMLGNSGCGATHFCKPLLSSSGGDDDEFSIFSGEEGAEEPTAPLQLSLTDKECHECVILPILFDSQRACFVKKPNGLGWKTETRHSYFLPVLAKRKGMTTYKAVGVVLFKLYTHTEIPEDPLSVLEETFGDCKKEFEFIIE